MSFPFTTFSKLPWGGDCRPQPHDLYGCTACWRGGRFMTNKLGSLYSHVFTCAACELPSANIWQPKTTPLATFRIDGSSWGGAGGGDISDCLQVYSSQQRPLPFGSALLSNCEMPFPGCALKFSPWCAFQGRLYCFQVLKGYLISLSQES